MAFQVKSTRRAAPIRMIVHGPPGAGKSTFAAEAPSPIFIAAEDGLEEISAEALEPHPKTFEDVLAGLEFVGTLGKKSIVLDSLDWLEPLVWDYTVRQAKTSKIKNIEDFGYGKGYVAALTAWRLIISRLEALRSKEMNVILIAHSARKTFKNPIGDDYERWAIKLHDRATDLFIEWSRIIAFVDFDISTEDTSGRVKALGTGKRTLRATPNPAFTSKIRTVHPFPERVPLPRGAGWTTFAAALAAAGETDEARVISLRGEVEKRIRELADAEVEEKVRDFLKEAGETGASLTEAIERLDITIEARRKAG